VDLAQPAKDARRPRVTATTSTRSAAVETIEGKSRSMNFTFLADHQDRRLSDLGSKAEGSAWRDPSASLMHTGVLAERIVVNALTSLRSVGVVLANQIDRIKQLQIEIQVAEIQVDRSVIEGLNRIRNLRNRATHDDPKEPSTGDALDALRDIHEIAQWFDHNFNPDRTPGFHYEQFKNPPDPEKQTDEGVQQRTSVVRGLKPEPPVSVADRKQVSIESLADLERGDLTPKWVYFATTTKAARDTTYDFAYLDGILCSAVFKNTKRYVYMSLVQEVQTGDMILLAYGTKAEYEAKLLLYVETPLEDHVGKAKAMFVLPQQLRKRLKEAGYSVDPKEREFTGFRVTPSIDLSIRGKAPRVERPPGNNTLWRWDLVRKVN